MIISVVRMVEYGMMVVYTIWWEVIYKTVSLFPYRVGFGKSWGKVVCVSLMIFWYIGVLDIKTIRYTLRNVYRIIIVVCYSLTVYTTPTPIHKNKKYIGKTMEKVVTLMVGYHI